MNITRLIKFIKKKYDGQLILLIFGWYGLGRMFIEGLRTDSLTNNEATIRVSQLLAGIIFIVCLVLLIFFAIRKPTKPLYQKAVVEGDAQEEFPLLNKIKEMISSIKDKKNVNENNEPEVDEAEENDKTEE